MVRMSPLNELHVRETSPALTICELGCCRLYPVASYKSREASFQHGCSRGPGVGPGFVFSLFFSPFCPGLQGDRVLGNIAVLPAQKISSQAEENKPSWLRGASDVVLS